MPLHPATILLMLISQDALSPYTSTGELDLQPWRTTTHVQYNLFNLVFSWFALANLWLTFSIIIELVPTSVKINLFVTAEVVSCLCLNL